MVVDAAAAARRTVDAAVGTVGVGKVSTVAVPLMIGTVVTFASDRLLGVSVGSFSSSRFCCGRRHCRRNRSDPLGVCRDCWDGCSMIWRRRY